PCLVGHEPRVEQLARGHDDARLVVGRGVDQSVEQAEALVALGQRVEVDLPLRGKSLELGRTDDLAQPAFEIDTRALMRGLGGLAADIGVLELLEIAVACRDVVVERGGRPTRGRKGQQERKREGEEGFHASCKSLSQDVWFKITSSAAV